MRSWWTTGLTILFVDSPRPLALALGGLTALWGAWLASLGPAWHASGAGRALAVVPVPLDAWGPLFLGAGAGLVGVLLWAGAAWDRGGRGAALLSMTALTGVLWVAVAVAALFPRPVLLVEIWFMGGWGASLWVLSNVGGRWLARRKGG